MSRNTRIWGGLLALALAAIAVTIAWRARTSIRNTNAERAKLDAQRVAANEEMKRLESSRATITEERAATAAELESLGKRKAAKPGRAGTSSSPAPNYANPADLLAKDPKLQALSIAAQRARFETTYGPFARLQRLTPEQLSKLAAAQARFDEAQQDLMITARAQNLPPKDPAIAALQRQAAEELRAAQVDALGEDGFAQLGNYERTLPARAIVQRFAGAMSMADQPLTFDQANQMTQLMAEAGPGRDGGGRLNTASIDWTVVDQRAAAILSDQQLTLFKRIEPIGGGASRWLAQLDQAMENARKTMPTEGAAQPRH